LVGAQEFYRKKTLFLKLKILSKKSLIILILKLLQAKPFGK
jgi:hypothetical protein